MLDHAERLGLLANIFYHSIDRCWMLRLCHIRLRFSRHHMELVHGLRWAQQHYLLLEDILLLNICFYSC